MKPFVVFVLCLVSLVAIGQSDSKTMHENAKTFMRQGDFDNAIIILSRALESDKNNMEMKQDLVLSYYYKRDYNKALDGIKDLLGRDDANVVTYQIAGNIYKALEEPKECEKVYKKGLKKFPKSGPLYSEYGELLWSKKDYAAIQQWEKGIQVDPAYAGNYYNAALYYFYTTEKVWGLIYGEIFVNMESISERTVAMKKLLWQGYKDKLFADANLMAGQDKNKNAFSKSILDCLNKQSSLANQGISTETLTMIRTRFILEWFDKYAGRFPFKLFDYQRQLMQEGMFGAYDQWLFGTVENLAGYDSWIKSHDEEYKNFTAFQKNRVFKMPQGQYYQDNKN
jgi:lipopolysaccharide biosynthesis regulator YciM